MSLAYAEFSRLIRGPSLSSNIWLRRGRRGRRGICHVTAVSQSVDVVEVEEFRRKAFEADEPLLLEGRAQGDGRPLGSNHLSVLSAFDAWFRPYQSSHHYKQTSQLERFGGIILPYELVQEDPLSRIEGGKGAGDWAAWMLRSEIPMYQTLGQLLRDHLAAMEPTKQEVQFIRFYAPLALIFAALDYNVANDTAGVGQLYIAQAPLNALPPELRSQLTPPEIVRTAGRGDIYDSSIWLGLEPTYTPWHRDPNPNLLCQLCSAKTVRLLPPPSGEQVFRQVQARLGRSGGSRIRGDEMMQGPERRVLHETIWGGDAPGGVQEARLGPGDALYIPKGWWHSVKSGFGDGRLNGSVNWWFR